MDRRKSFNSKLVRLKAQEERVEDAGKIAFQFQTGSIKRPEGRKSLATLVLFQFQTGSIRRTITTRRYKVY